MITRNGKQEVILNYRTIRNIGLKMNMSYAKSEVHTMWMADRKKRLFMGSALPQQLPCRLLQHAWTDSENLTIFLQVLSKQFSRIKSRTSVGFWSAFTEAVALRSVRVFQQICLQTVFACQVCVSVLCPTSDTLLPLRCQMWLHSCKGLCSELLICFKYVMNCQNLIHGGKKSTSASVPRPVSG